MSKPRKLRGNSDSPVTQFKARWPTLAPASQDYWRALFISATSQAAIRQEIAGELNIALTADKQLNAIRDWLDDQDQRDAERERQAEDERRLEEQFGGTMTKDQVRDLVLKASYARTIAHGDFKLGLATAKVDLKDKELLLGRQKFEFDAAKAALAKLPELNAIKRDSSLNEDAKLEQARLKLFGETPA